MICLSAAMKDNPTNQFVAEVSIPFPDDMQGLKLMRWFNLQNCGKESVPPNTKVSKSHRKNARRLHQNREFQFVFEITKEGEWKFVGRRA